MENTVKVPQFIGQATLDLGFDLGPAAYAAVTEAKANRQVRDDSLVISKAKEAAKITAANLDAQSGMAAPKPVTIDLFGSAPATAPNKTSPPKPQETVVLDPAILLPDVPFPFSELNKNSAKPFPDEPSVARKKDLPKGSYMAQEAERMQLAADFLNKPVVGLMRTIHTADRKVHRKALPEKPQNEGSAKEPAPKASAFDFGWMMREDIMPARVETKPMASEDPDDDTPDEPARTAKFRP